MNETLKDLCDFPQMDEAALTIGNFDGCHLGHQSLFAEIDTRHPGLPKAAVTFSETPSAVIHPEHYSGDLFSEGMKLRALKYHRFDPILSLDFTAVRNIPPRDFIAFLAGRVRKLSLYVGFNFRFGRDNAGNTQSLKALAHELGFSLHVHEPFRLNGNVVSSSAIRKFIENGQMEEASEMLGRPYWFESTVEKGDQIGRTIDFPTLNFALNRQVIPGKGVYLTYLAHQKQCYLSMTYVGQRPTLDGKSLRIETHVISPDGRFTGIPYGEKTGLFWVRKIRGEKKFHNLDELKKTLYNDRESVLTLAVSESCRQDWNIYNNMEE